MGANFTPKYRLKLLQKLLIVGHKQIWAKLAWKSVQQSFAIASLNILHIKCVQGNNSIAQTMQEEYTLIGISGHA